MLELTTIEAIEYLVIGHVTRDENSDSPSLGGTAAYAALTARALGLRVGILTSCGVENSFDALDGIYIISIPSKHTTTFENIYIQDERQQILHQIAAPISFDHVPEAWRRTPIIHLGPVANEIEPQLPAGFSPALLGLTPQGWLRAWDAKGRIGLRKWLQMEASLNGAGAAVLSLEDVNGDEELIEEMSLASRVLVITEGAEGARLYWNNDLRRFPAPSMNEVDPTGAGDIFAAAFFIRLHSTRDPWEAARFATQLAAYSVTRRGLAGIPTMEEIQSCQMEVL